jgi:hypothetical protein
MGVPAEQKPWEWDNKKDRAAELFAEGVPYLEIARTVRSSKDTLAKWRRTPEFCERIEEYRREVARRVSDETICRVEHRLRMLAERHELLNRVIRERAAHESYRDAPGGTTGLLVRREKPKDKNGGTIVEFEVDETLLSELREHEKQAAKELGQWVDRKEVDINDGRDVEDRLIARLQAMARQRAAALGVDGGGAAPLPGQPEAPREEGPPARLGLLGPARPDAPAG